MTIRKADVIVVGAGPAGSTAAEQAALKGADVVIIERRAEVGVPVRCGEYIPHGEEISRIFTKVQEVEETFDFPSNLVKRELEAIRIFTPKLRRYDIPFLGFTTDRTEFDQHLAQKAVKAGAELITKCAFQGREGNRIFTSQGEMEAKVLIGADGPGSKVARSLGLRGPKVLYPAFTAQAKGDFEPVCVMYFGGIAPGGYGWIIPKKGTANIGVGAAPKYATATTREYFDRFVDWQDLEVISRMSGKYVPSSGPVKETVRDNGLIVGDAAGHVMAVNGGGVPVSLICGRIAGKVAANSALKGTPLKEYEDTWKEQLWKPLRTAVHTKWLADQAFRTDLTLELSMRILGARRMGKVIKCRPAFP
jgi:digeranylgeranylglycerophospholipid reductase